MIMRSPQGLGRGPSPIQSSLGDGTVWSRHALVFIGGKHYINITWNTF